MLNNALRFTNEVALVSQLLSPNEFTNWLSAIPGEFITLLKTRSLGILDRSFGDSFEVKWNHKKLNFKGLDFGVVREIYGHQCYARSGDLKNARHILDLGANGGAFSVFALEEAPEAQVHSVEVLPHYVSVAKNNINKNGHSKRSSLEWAIVGGFYDEWTNNVKAKHPSLEVFDIRKYIAEVGTCDFIKCDVEGGEFLLFEGDLSWLYSVKKMALEYHPTKGNVEALYKTLKKYDFHVERADHSALGYFYCSRY